MEILNCQGEENLTNEETERLNEAKLEYEKKYTDYFKK